MLEHILKKRMRFSIKHGNPGLSYLIEGEIVLVQRKKIVDKCHNAYGLEGVKGDALHKNLIL